MSLEQGKGPTEILHVVISVLVGFHPAIRNVHKLHSADGVRQFFRDSVLWPFYAVPCVDLQLVSVVFPGHTHLLL